MMFNVHICATGVCSEEYGFDHPDERVCKAMFERTEEKAVANIEHVSQQSTIECHIFRAQCDWIVCIVTAPPR
jgi:hypothetical protein